MILPPTRRGDAEKTWVLRGLSAAKVELTRGGVAQGGLVAPNFPRAVIGGERAGAPVAHLVGFGAGESL